MRQITLLVCVLSSMLLCADSGFDAVLSQHRERVAAERKRIEARHADCSKCNGTSEVVDKDLCETCHGSGLIATHKGKATISKLCAECSGKGFFERRTPCSKCCPYVVVESKTEEEKKPEAKQSAPEKQKCADCSGKGYHVKEVGCGSCNGSGTIYTPPKQMISGWTKERHSKCSSCSGRGKKSVHEKCKTCKGLGHLKQENKPEQKPPVEKKAPPPKFDLLKWLIWSAEHGDAMSQYCLGVMYATGDGVKKSEKESEKWLKMSADEGNAFARMLEDAKIAEQNAKVKKAREAAEAAARAAEEKRLAEEKRAAEEKRLAEEKRAAEEKRLAEERRIAEEQERAEALRLEAEQREMEEQRQAQLVKEKAEREAREKEEAAKRKARTIVALVTFGAGMVLAGVVIGLLIFTLGKFIAFKVKPELKTKVSAMTLSKIKHAIVLLTTVIGIYTALSNNRGRGDEAKTKSWSSAGERNRVSSIREDGDPARKALNDLIDVFTLCFATQSKLHIFSDECGRLYLFILSDGKALKSEIDTTLYLCKQLRTCAAELAESVKLMNTNYSAAQREQLKIVVTSAIAAAESYEEYCNFLLAFYVAKWQLAQRGIGPETEADVEEQIRDIANHQRSMKNDFAQITEALRIAAQLTKK